MRTSRATCTRRGDTEYEAETRASLERENDAPLDSQLNGRQVEHPSENAHLGVRKEVVPRPVGLEVEQATFLVGLRRFFFAIADAKADPKPDLEVVEDAEGAFEVQACTGNLRRAGHMGEAEPRVDRHPELAQGQTSVNPLRRCGSASGERHQDDESERHRTKRLAHLLP
jgi:hypothetical protein